MKKIIKQSIIAIITVFTVNTSQAQSPIPFPVPSPQTTLVQNFATSKIEINYARPSMRGRKVFGDVVAYNQFWRTGANNATTILFGEDVKVNGIDVKAGKYGLVTFPGENEWIIVLSKDFPTWEGAYKQENDVARFKVQPIKLNYSVETFTIDVTNIRENSCVIMLSWENTGVAFNVTSY
jgi:hypothetical protein